MFGFAAHGRHGRRRRTPLAWAAVFAWLACPLSLADWQARVVDTDGNPVPYAAVLLTNAERSEPDEVAAIVAQQDAEFVPHASIITVGTAVEFPNRDRARHHVYSFSDARSFEIELYSGTPAEPVVFDRAGIVTMGCNVHDWMYGMVYVVETPYFALTDEDGIATIPGLPQDEFEVTVWHPRRTDSSPVGSVKTDGTQASPHDISVTLRPAATRPKRPAPLTRVTRRPAS